MESILNENIFIKNYLNRKNSSSTKNIYKSKNNKKNLFLFNNNLEKNNFIFNNTFLKLNNEFSYKNNNSNLNIFNNNNKRKNNFFILNEYQRVKSLSPSKEKNIQLNIKTISNELEKSPYYNKIFINPPISFTQKFKNNIIKNKLLFPINKNNNLVDYIKKCSSTQQKKLFSYKKNNLNRNKSFNKGIFSDLKPFQLFKNDINNF
jgi:hypothetical protein